MTGITRSVLLSMLVGLTGAAFAGARATAQPASPPAADVACDHDQLQIEDARATSPGAAVGPADDERLYRAGVCYQRGGAPAEAIAAFLALRERFPRSGRAAQALARLGDLYARGGRYDEAAAAREEYGTRYPAEDDAAAALSDAVRYRAALGDDARAIAITRSFIRTFGGKRPGEAASAFFGLASIYERQGKKDALLRHYRAYLKTYGAKGGADRVVMAHARIGQLLWDQSCRRAIDGSCVEVAPASVAPCGPATRRAVRRVDRDRRMVEEATAAFAAATRTYQAAGGRFAGGDELAARHHYALARFHQAELEYEASLALTAPAGLDFDPARPAEAKRSTARLRTWLTERQARGAAATAAYGALFSEIKDPELTIAAAARIGQLAQRFAETLRAVEVPASIRTVPEAVEAFCHALTELAEPFEGQAVEAFGACLRVSTDLGWSSSWTQLCERELAVLRPAQHPTASELRPALLPTTVPPTLLELPTSAAP